MASLRFLAWETIFWIVWIVAFCGVELCAMCRRRQSYTLTGHVWWITEQWAWTRALIALLLLWLVFHFLIEPHLRK